ncbi:MAG: PQQ-binding-like beta-propeller repeat protein [Planctomycetota bacterium]
MNLPQRYALLRTTAQFGWTLLTLLAADLIQPSLTAPYSRQLHGTACAAAEPSASGADRGIADFTKLSAETDWPWWRGPARNGIAAASAKAPPTTWSDSQNVIWKTAVPGRGHSSPIIVRDRVFLTTAQNKTQVHSVLGFDRATGKLLWQQDVSQGGFPAHNHPKNTEATSTLASDGERLIATFFHHETVEAIALDFDGQVQWRQKAGSFNPRRYEYGYAPSPLLYRNSVIMAMEYDGDSSIVALERSSGKSLWRTPRPANISFSSPVIAHLAGEDQLLMSGGEKITSLNPATGKALWSTEGTATATCGTIVWDGDTIFASGGYPQSETVAVKADGSGQVLWRNNQKCYEQSMLAVDGYLYALTDNGVVFCWRATDGQEQWKKRLQGPVSSSPVLAGGHIYWSNEGGITYVFKPNPKELEIVAENRLGDDGFASPAVVGNRLFLRGSKGSGDMRQEFLYCLGMQ